MSAGNSVNRERASFMKFAMLTLLSLGTVAFLIFAVSRTVEKEVFRGNPPVTPAWALKHMVWEDNGNSRDSAEALVDGYLSRHIPVGAIIIDSPWSTAYNDFEWDTARYHNPRQMIDDFHARNVKVILWATGFVNVSSVDAPVNPHPDYDLVKRRGYTVSNGRHFRWWKGTGAHIDFTNPAARNWWHSRMDKVLDMGIDGWKVDQSASHIPDPVLTSIGYLSRDTFRKYYYADFYDYTVSKNSSGVIMARGFSPSGTDLSDGLDVSPITKTPLVWNGDYTGSFSGLIEQMNDLYDSAGRGYGAPGVEIGGYDGAKPTKNSLIRYAQFAAMTPLMENGGRNGGLAEHLPWFWDTETVDIYRYFATLHNELGHYLFSLGVESSLHGGSIVRGASKTQSHHRLGEQIFVSILTSDTTIKTIELPAGARWIDYWNEESNHAGDSTFAYHAPLDRFPIFIKAGAIIPLDVKNNVCGHGDDSSAGRITVLVYPAGASTFLFHRPTGEGTAYEDIEIGVQESTGTLTVKGATPANYIFRVKSFSAPASVTGGTNWSYDNQTKTVIVNATGADFVITINGLMGYTSDTLPGTASREQTGVYQ